MRHSCFLNSNRVGTGLCVRTHENTFSMQSEVNLLVNTNPNPNVRRWSAKSIMERVVRMTPVWTGFHVSFPILILSKDE